MKTLPSNQFNLSVGMSIIFVLMSLAIVAMMVFQSRFW